MAEELRISRAEEGGAIVLSLAGRLDSFAAVDTDPALMQVAESAQCPVILDLGGLEYVSSLGLQTLLRFAKSLEKRGQALCLCNPTPFVTQVLQISHFSELFRIQPSREEALRSCSVAGSGA